VPAGYSDKDDVAAFGLLANTMFDGGSDRGATFPRSDAEDMSRGARFIPGQVTLARRKGQTVDFVSDCGLCCWYWQMPDGSRIYHFDRFTYDGIARHNHGDQWDSKTLAGICPNCGNTHTNGGTVTREEVVNDSSA
jgi:hypothetical protein